MNLDHSFAVSVEWQGNRGTGTSGYKDFSRDHVVRVDAVPGKHEIEGSAARPFHGDAERWNPEEQLIAALAQCHMLSYLHVATRAGVVVESYTDAATGTLHVEADDSGALVEVVLHPVVAISAGDPAVAQALHAEANRLCFIANSVNFPVRHEPRLLLLDDEL
ncbi:OsmC family protein [Lysinimonas soli]|uniref:OsmC family protein n=1 Tax=Lysinimonas soli TaxID=1074233 RepID=A0ABW0NML7_9MICO